MTDSMVDRHGWVCRRVGKDGVEYRRPFESWVPHPGSWSRDAAAWVHGYGYRYVSRLELVLLIPEAAE